MERALARREEIGVALGERETVAAILEREARPRHDDVRAEGMECGLDVAHHHPVGVGGAEIGRIAAQRITHLGQQRLLADQRAAFRGVCLGKQLLDGNVLVLRVGDDSGVRRRRPASSPQVVVEAFDRVARKLAQLIAFEDIERQQRGQSLGAWWHLPDVVATIARRDRLDPVAGMSRQVFR